MPTNEKFRIVCKKDEDCEITIYDVIDPFWGVTASAIRDALKDAGKVKTIRMRINSPGGNVFEGTAIYNLLKSHAAKKIVTVDGLAASMASVVAMAGDEIEMGEGAYLMIHDPVGSVWGGDSEAMREYADLLDKTKSQIVDIYARRTGRTKEEVSALMSAETWMTGEEAVTEKFADRTVPGLAVAAQYDLARFSKVPKALNQAKETAMTEPLKPTPATVHELKDTFPKASAEWREDQQVAGATMEQARASYAAMVEKENDELRAKATAAENALAEAKAQTTNSNASGQKIEPEGGKKTGGDNTGDPIAAWEEAHAALVAKGLKPAKAMAKLVKDQPEMHAAYLAAYNEQHAAARR